MITKQDIIDMAREDPIIYNCYDMWYNGLVTWEEALMMMVKGLKMMKDEVINKHIQLLNNMPSPQIIVKRDDNE